MSDQQDRIKGALYGQAIGDSLGLPGEFKSSTLLAKKYGKGEPNCYEAVDRKGMGGSWKPGEWSDDTEQALAILDAYLDDGDIVPRTVAKKFTDWAQTNGRGMGNHTWNVISDAHFLLDPIAVSEAVWEKSGRRSAPNGGVMRTSVVGILRPADLLWTERAAATVCRVTHADPRCVASAVAISVAIAVLVEGGGVESALDNATARAQDYHSEINDYADMTLEQLQLDEGMDGPRKGRPPIGYTYKCAGAGLWALGEMGNLFKRRMRIGPPMFLSILQRVIRAGGDTDTNGAVAGAVLGAAMGFRNMDRLAMKPLVEGLQPREELDSRLALLETLP